MRYFFSIVMLMFAAVAFSKVVGCFVSNNHKKTMYQAFSYTALGSAISASATVQFAHTQVHPLNSYD